MWFKDGLPPFNEFYFIPSEPVKQYTSEEYIARYNSWT
jgi:hypothetical protein